MFQANAFRLCFLEMRSSTWWVFKRIWEKLTVDSCIFNKVTVTTMVRVCWLKTVSVLSGKKEPANPNPNQNLKQTCRRKKETKNTEDRLTFSILHRKRSLMSNGGTSKENKTSSKLHVAQTDFECCSFMLWMWGNGLYPSKEQFDTLMAG